jgi:hypothetical protein
VVTEQVYNPPRNVQGNEWSSERKVVNPGSSRFIPPSVHLQLDRILLQIEVVLHVGINSLPDNFGCFVTVLLPPFSIPFIFRLGMFLLPRISTAGRGDHYSGLTVDLRESGP